MLTIPKTGEALEVTASADSRDLSSEPVPVVIDDSTETIVIAEEGAITLQPGSKSVTVIFFVPMTDDLFS